MSIKKWVKEHKKEIIIGVTVAGVTIGGVIFVKRWKAGAIDRVAHKLCKLRGATDLITWKDTGGSHTLEQVKELLELNKNASSRVAIVRKLKDGLDAYAVIQFGDPLIEVAAEVLSNNPTVTTF